MVNSIKLSVIIPVYNVEKYIKRNIDSLVALKDANIELIYVDDGSPDQSVAIIEQYREKDNRIKLLRQKNGGLSAARNAGIDMAKGEWILFVDGDDWIDAGLLENMLAMVESPNDIIWGTYEVVNENRKIKESSKCENACIGLVKNGIEWMIQEKVMFVPCIYLYKADLIKHNRVYFPLGFLHEDMEFIPEIFYYAKSVKYVGIPFYKYVDREGSISNTKNSQRSKDLIRIAQNIEQFENERVKNRHYKEWLKTYRGMICAQAVHIAILNDISWAELFAEKRLRNLAISYLVKSGRIRDKVIAASIVFHLAWAYTKVYRYYNKKLRQRGKKCNI